MTGIMESSVIYLDEYAKELNLVITVFIETENSGLLDILNEEKIKAGLDSIEVHLMLPEIPEEADTDPDLLARSGKINSNDYQIILFPLAMKRWGRSARHEIRHEIAHIKYGDLDRKLPSCLKTIYNLLVEEPRARWYALNGY